MQHSKVPAINPVITTLYNFSFCLFIKIATPLYDIFNCPDACSCEGALTVSQIIAQKWLGKNSQFFIFKPVQLEFSFLRSA